MRELKIGTRKYAKVVCYGVPGNGNDCHEYAVLNSHPSENSKDLPPLTYVRFQNGPIKEAGVNGCQNEDLISMVIDRLQGFQEGAFACRENAIAMTKLEESLMWLRKRTQDREDRGVEGTNIK